VLRLKGSACDRRRVGTARPPGAVSGRRCGFGFRVHVGRVGRELGSVVSGLIVSAVRRAIAFEVEHGARYQLAMDRLWFWRVSDSWWHEDWQPSVNTASINHFLAVHRENHRKRLSPHQVLSVVRLPGLVERGVGEERASPPASPGNHVSASNTTPESRNLRQIGVSGGK